jgi:hypothetical protein
LPTPDEEYEKVKQAQKKLKKAQKRYEELKKAKDFVTPESLTQASLDIGIAKENLEDAKDDYDDFLDYLDYLYFDVGVDPEKVWKRQEAQKKTANDPNAPFRADPSPKLIDPFGGLKLTPGTSYVPSPVDEIGRVPRPYLGTFDPMPSPPIASTPPAVMPVAPWPPMWLPGSSWGSGDGRSTFDLQYDKPPGPSRSIASKPGCSCKPSCVCKPMCTCK